MAKNLFFKIYYILTVIIVIAECIILVKETASFDIENLPKGTFQYEAVSPDGATTLSVYKIENSVCSSMRVSADCDDQDHNIYWQTQVNDVNIEWISDSIVIINSVPLDISKGDTYDCRKGLSIFAEGSVQTNEQ